jgi:hypothetical protein
LKIKTLNRLFLAIAVGLLCCAPGFAQSQRLANPSYFYPGPFWATLEAAAPTAGIAVVNPNSGPGASANPAYATQINEAEAHGLKVVGYVDTNYGKRSMELVGADIRAYYRWYHVDGILFDDVSNLAPDLDYYKACYSLVRSVSPKAMVIINPGCPTIEGYMKTADIVITFESPFKDYQTNFVQSPWVMKYPASRFWHIILGAVTEQDMLLAVKESKERHAGWVYVAPYAPPANPYDKLPPAPYWSGELAAIKSSK